MFILVQVALPGNGKLRRNVKKLFYPRFAESTQPRLRDNTLPVSDCSSRAPHTARIPPLPTNSESSMTNPYSEWLNLPSDGSRPDHYMLLGLPLFEADPGVITEAVQTQVAATGQHVVHNKALAQRVLREIEEARQCLLDPSQKAAYDAELEKALGGSPTAISDAAVAQPAPIAATAAAPEPTLGNEEEDDDDEDLPVANLAEELLPPGAAPSVKSQPTMPAQPARRAAAPKRATTATQVQVRPTDPPRKSSGPSAVVIWGSAAVVLALITGVVLYAAGIGPFAAEEKLAENTNGSNADNTEANSDNSANDGTLNAPNNNAAVNSNNGNSDGPLSNTPSTNTPEDNTPANNNTANNANTPTTDTPANNAGENAGNNNTAPPDVSALAAIQENLFDARYALAERDFATAEEKIAAAAELDSANQHRQEIEATRTLANYSANFWTTVENAVRSLQPADQIELGGVAIGIVAVDADGVTIRREGKNERHEFATMQKEFAYALALQAFPENSAAGKLSLAAFLIVDPEGNQQRVEELLAEVEGQEPESVQLLRAEMQLIASANPLGTPSGEGNMGTPRGDSPTENANPGTGFGAKVAMPADAAVEAALTSLATEFESQIQQAQEPGQHQQLSEELSAAAKQEPDAVRRLALLQLATEQSALANNASAMLELIDLTGDYFEADVLELKSSSLAQAARWPPESREPVVTAALDLADDAILLERYAEAVALARTAQAAARGLGKSDLLKAAAERAVAFGQLAREERNR